jgi:hypothetical protein
MRALTIRNPWAWAIAHGHKKVENRTWVPHIRNLRTFIAISASKEREVPATHTLKVNELCPTFPQGGMEFGAVVAVVRLVGLLQLDEYCDVVDQMWHHKELSWPQWCEQNPLWRRWAFGPRCWVFDDVFKLPKPVPCKGSLGLWMLPDSVLEPIRRQWKPPDV